MKTSAAIQTKKISPLQIIRSETGVAWPLILIILVMVSVVGFGLGGLTKSRHDESKRLNQRLSGKYLAKHFEKLIARQKVWTNTMTANSATMACVAGGTCDAGPHIIPIIKDSANQLIYNHDLPLKGFSPTGEPCETAGTADCPFRLKLTWNPNCPTGAATCTPTAITVRGEIELAGASAAGTTYNSANYSFEMQK